MKKLFISLIEFYQRYLSFDNGVLAYFAPGGACKYDISCSEFAKQAINKNGVLNGTWLGMKRFWSCR